MKDQHRHQDIEEGQYELTEGPAYQFGLNRRRFLQLFTGGLAVAVVFGAAASREGVAAQTMSGKLPDDQIGAWLHITEEGKVVVYTGKVEVGQNIRTSLAQAVAEELRVSIESIEMVMGDTDRTPYDRGTFGSRSTPQMGMQLRRAAAAARETLLEKAAAKWKTNREALRLDNGKITAAGKSQSLSFGELTQGEQLVKTIREEELTSPEKWTIAGTSAPKVNGRSFVTGRHKYTTDMRLPGMLYGKVLRPPAFGAELLSADLSEAKAMPGVVAVQDGPFIGVAAPDLPAASRALAAIRAEWKTTPQVSQNDLFEHLKKTGSQGGGRNSSPRVEGSVKEGLASADHSNEQLYTAQYIAHAPLEPRAALAQWEDGKLTVWTGTQRPFGVHGELTQAFQLPEDRVRVIMPDTGSGYGGKHTGEAAIEAARLARAAGKPVKLVWTRQEEFTWAYFRPAARIEVKSGAGKDGRLTAWEFHTYNAGGAAIDTYYEVPNLHIQSHPSDSPLRQGSYRGLAAVVNHFARESHMDELAHQLGMDPLEFRFKNLKNERLVAVLNAAAEKFGWGQFEPGPGSGFGLACGIDKGGYTAACAEISADRSSGAVRVVRVVAAFECGAIVNPDHLKNQVEGSIIQGLGGALFEGVEFEDGKIRNPSFSTYRTPRFGDTPELEVVLLDRKDLPSAGAGETPIVGIAPAVGNAIFAATGVRLRSLPMVPNGLAF